jgi:hypothetical protein
MKNWEEDNRINTSEQTEGEIKIALKALKAGKAPGTDNIPPEILKADLETSVKILYTLFTNIWERKLYLKNGRKGS